MSRWTDQFEAHAFQSAWTNLKDALNEAVVDDETILTSVNELARLKKVVEYLDGMIEGVDHEMVPFSIWDSFNAQATACTQQIIAYNSNKNIAHITKANVHVDNLMTYLRPYMVLPKEAAASIKRAATMYSKTVEKYVDSFQEKSSELVQEIEGYRAKADELISLIEPIKESVDKFDSELFGDEGVQERMRELLQDAEEKNKSIDELHDETLIGEGDKLSTKQAITLAKESILEEQGKIEILIESVSDEVDNLDKFHTKIFGEVGEDGVKVGGLSGDLDGLQGALVDFEGKQKIRYKALNDEIETLLPGATSAGLATAYKNLKESFNKPIRNVSYIFYGSLGLLVLVSLLLAVKSVGGESWITFVSFDKWDVVLKGIVYKIPFYAPVLWLAFFSTKRRSEYQRLQQEYAHKEALAKSYNSYKKQLEELGDSDGEMQKEFILKTVESIVHNASETLDGKHGDKMPAQEMFESAVSAAVKLSNPK
jgi:hypothetical protein